MKNSGLSLIAGLLLLIALTSCESFVTNIPESKLPKAESKLVVNSVISPQLKYITVIVTESFPLFVESNATEERIKNASVKLSDETSEILIPYDQENNLYSLEQSKFPIHPSKTYKLTVSAGARSATATCTVPAKAPVIEAYTFDTLILENAFYVDTLITLKMNWKDIPADSNQYRVNAVAQVESSVWSKDASGKHTEKRITTPFSFLWNWQQGKDEFQIDNYQDGAAFSSPLGKIHLPRLREENRDGKMVKVFPKNRVKSVVMEVYNIDKHYYKYHQSLKARMNNDNPFSEPTTIYTNIVGGFGCFAAYNAGRIEVKDYK